MQLLVLLAAAALLGNCCQSANINKHNNMKLLPEINNSIEPNVVVPAKHSTNRKFVTITGRPKAAVAHAAGTTVELTCEALGAPAPTIHWYKNDAPVYEFDSESTEIIDTNPTSLGRVASTLLVTRTHDRDEYTCLALSGAHTARASTTVYSTDGSTELSERSKLVPLAPRILVSYKVYLDTIGSNIVLPCHAKGHPKPHVSWTRRDSKDTLIKRDPRMKVLRSGELVISRLRWTDMGEYTCHASNSFGSQLANTFVYPAKAG